MISKLHYISQGTSATLQEVNIRKALDYGANWIQLRWKNATEKELLQLSEKVKKQCENFKATFIVNDSVKIAKLVDAHGVHLGLKDESIIQAKQILGSHKIIGGTANTLEHVIQRIHEGCSYIGVGPFRFTTTKQQLSPILGIDGFTNIIKAIEDTGIQLPPIIAIGGITVADIENIKKTGIYGVALSGFITQSPEKISLINKLIQ